MPVFAAATAQALLTASWVVLRLWWLALMFRECSWCHVGLPNLQLAANIASLFSKHLYGVLSCAFQDLLHQNPKS